MADNTKKPNIFVRMGSGIKRWAHEMRSELKKVSWPNKKELKKSSIVVICTLLAFTVFIWAVDSVFAFLVRLIAG